MLKHLFRPAVVGGLALLAVAATGPFGGLPAARAQGALPYAPNQVLIEFVPGATPAQQDEALALVQGHVREQVLTPAMREARSAPLTVAGTRRSVPEAVQALSRHPAVAVAEPNWVVTHSATSNDPQYTNGNLWGMYGDASSPANAFGSQAAEAWANANTGSGAVYVGIIDEGVDVSHPDLAANIWSNPFDWADGVDNDGNGYIDDANGWDFVNRDNTVYDEGHDDHGTHVAGTIGGVGGNGIGVAGVNWSVTMISAKFLSPDGGYISDAVKAVDYFTDLKQRHGLNIVATNNSWGGGGYSSAMHSAINRAAKVGILFIAAAGNSGANNDRRASYPSNYSTLTSTSTESAAAYDAVVAVAAIDRTGAKPKWSNYGAKTVDLGAPGVGIVSTVPGGYASYNGTSMATPHVTGAAALYAASHSGAGAPQIRSAILNSTIPTSSMNKKTVTGGRLDAGGF